MTPGRLLQVLVAVLMALAGAAWCVAAHAQTKAAAPVELPEPLTREAASGLVSGLDDRAARALLLGRLNAEADRQAALRATREARSLTDVVGEQAHLLARFLADVIAKVPAIPSSTARGVQSFAAARGDRAFGLLWLTLALSVAAGAVAWLASRSVIASAAMASWRWRRDLWRRLGRASLRMIAWLAQILAFLLAAHLANAALNSGNIADRMTVRWIIGVIGWTAFGIAFVRLVLAPRRPELRLCVMSDGEAQFLARRLALIIILFNIGFGLTTWLFRFGVPFSDAWLGFWVNLVLHILLVVTIWQARTGIAQMVVGSTDEETIRASRLAAWWPPVAIMLVTANWLAAELVVASDALPIGLIPAMAATLAVLIGLPLLDSGLRAAVGALVEHDVSDRPALQAAAVATRRGLVRVARVAGAALLVLLVLWLWRVDIVRLAEQGIGARFASSVLGIGLVLAIAYGLWELVRIVTDRHIAFEKVALGIDEKAEGELEGEGGGAGARLGTLLPLVRLAAEIAIAVSTGLAVLGELGVNVWPLIAGASIIGLAIGFGSQALVKDIISGVFFLIDDAFRKGEYIDIGSVKGTVERISLRSMQLRHHNGPLHTVPFGDIRHVTNYSRDWVVMKLSLRLTYDTDAEKVRKMIKRLGEELLTDPEHGPKFLQPLKSQGVIEMDDSAMIMRVKFMTRPGDQWAIRRIVFNRIRELFERNGIRFASREVVVRMDGKEVAPAAADVARAGAAAARAAAQLSDPVPGAPRT